MPERSLTGVFMCRSGFRRYDSVMKRLSWTLRIGLLLAALGTPATGTFAGEAGHDRARRAVEAGEIKPLREILAAAEKSQGGQLIEAELDDEHGRMVYELKLLTSEGRVVKLYYDARTGLQLERDRRNGHDGRK